MQGRQMLLMAAMLSFVACGDSEDTSAASGASSTGEAEATEATEAAEEAEPATAENANTRDIHGLRVTVNDDGTIAIQGVDRWGGRLDTVYADTTYFRNAVPVLKRSVTEEQGTGLDELLETLPEPEAAPTEGAGMEPAPIAPPAPATMAATMATVTMAPAPATMAPAAPIEGAMAP